MIELSDTVPATINEQFAIRSLPFDFGSYTTRPESIPEYLPFILSIDQNGLIRQTLTEKLRSTLHQYYTWGGYGSTPLGEGLYGKSQGDFMLSAITAVLDKHNRKVSGSTFVEIGASYGYLLHSLANHGAKEVLGIEPGEEGIIGSKKYGVSMVREFFPTPVLSGRRFDFVLNHCMLEHAEDPLSILKEMYQITADNGIVLFAIPDCNPKMVIGDLSIISHQHVNYFTRNSIRYLLELAGFRNVGMMTSNNRAILIAWGTRLPSGSNEPYPLKPCIEEDGEIFLRFAKQFSLNVIEIQNEVIACENENKTIGLYAPDPNVAGLIKFKYRPRTFNTDRLKTGKYVGPLVRPFESPEDLVANPVDVLVVAPVDYDRQIESEIRSMGLKKATKIVSLRQIYERVCGYPYSLKPSSENEFTYYIRQ